jgi:hypothetical protein
LVRINFSFPSLKREKLNRRYFTIAASGALLIGTQARAELPGVKVRFVITRLTKVPGSTETRSTYENAVLVAPGERFQADFQDEYRFSFRPVSTSNGVRVEVSLIDLKRHPMDEMSGQVEIRIGQGGGLTLRSLEGESYEIGLLVTTQPLPKNAV